jgi:hypothetical protein
MKHLAEFLAQRYALRELRMLRPAHTYQVQAAVESPACT